MGDKRYPILGTNPAKRKKAIKATDTTNGTAMEMIQFFRLANRIMPASVKMHATAPNVQATTEIPNRNSQLRIEGLNKDMPQSTAIAKAKAKAPDQ